MSFESIFIISGTSGSGKSTALAAFEDAGFYCVDNLPVALLPSFLELVTENPPDKAGFAFVMDLREKGFLDKYKEIFNALRTRGNRFQILFLEAEEQVLVKRYSQTRRQHPLVTSGGLPEGIRTEIRSLLGLRKSADRIIDTSRLNVHNLKAIISDIARKSSTPGGPFSIHVTSFGFKYGTPYDADLLIDVRFLANPYFIPELEPMTGKMEPVRQFVFKDPNCQPFLDKYLDLLTYLIPLYEKEGKSYLTIAVGCTGGRHRSVAVSEFIFEHLKKPGVRITISHRDLDQ